MIFQAVHPARLDSGLARLAAVSWVVFAVAAASAWLLCSPLGLSRPVAGGFILAAALGNTGYIGYPVSEALLGAGGLVRAIFSDVFGTVAALLFVGLLIAQRMGSSDEGRINPIREALAFPAVGAVFAALLLRPVEIPSVVGGGLEALANLVVPLIMISVGLSLRLGSLREHWGTLVALAGVRLVAAPLLALGVGTLVLSDPGMLRLAVLQASMPSMMLTLVIGERFRLDTDFIAAAILVTTIASIASIPAMQLLAS
jgi:predicted permease